jgi:hypothetical protein
VAGKTSEEAFEKWLWMPRPGLGENLFGYTCERDWLWGKSGCVSSSEKTKAK